VAPDLRHAAHIGDTAATFFFFVVDDDGWGSLPDPLDSPVHSRHRRVAAEFLTCSFENFDLASAFPHPEHLMLRGRVRGRVQLARCALLGREEVFGHGMFLG